VNIYHSDAPKPLSESRCVKHNVLRCGLCEGVNPTIKASPAIEPAAPPSVPEIPGWISGCVDTTIEYSAGGMPVKARMAVCAECKNTARVCEAYQVCEKPTRRTVVAWDNDNGENLKVRNIFIENEKVAEERWRIKQQAQAVKRMEPAVDGATVTPIAPGFEGFAVIATRAAEKGFLVHPVTAGTKFPPLLSGFQHKATSNLSQIALWAQQYPLANAGAMATPGGHIFLDEDNVPRIQELYRERYGEDYPRTYATESQPGHRQTAWLQTDASRSLGNVTQGTTKELVMSVRQKNYYVMVAGSIHPDTKKPYRVVDDSAIVSIPDKLVEFIRWLKAERVKEIAAEKAAKDGAKMVSPTATTAAPSTPTALTPADENVADVNEYLNAENDPPLLGGDRVYGEGERNNATSRFAYRRWVMELATAEELREDVQDFNAQNNNPPLSDNEVNTLINAKLKLVQKGNGIIQDGELQPTSKLTVESVAATAAAVAAFEAKRPLTGATVEEQMQEIEDRQAENPDAETPTLDYGKLLLARSALAAQRPSWIDQHVQTASQLSREPLEWSIWDMLLYHGSNIICGKHGSMKSIIALAMAKALLTDSGFAGRKTKGKKIRVVYCDKENPEAVVMERLIGLGLVDADGREIPGFHIWGGWPSAEFPPPDEMDDPRLIEDAKRHPETFYFFDSLSSFTGGAEENDNPEMVKHMNKVKALARMCAGTLVQHHTDKDGKKEWRGAGAIIDQSDHAMYLKRPDKKNGLVMMGEIRFRACQEWNNKLRVNFSNTFPDGRIGLHISYSTLDSGIRPGALGAATGAGATGEPVPIGELVSDSDAEVDLTKGDDALIEKAERFIQQTWDEGREINQTQLKDMLGVTSGTVKARVLCATGRPWQTRPGLRSNALCYYPLGVSIPTPEEQEAAKDAKAEAKAAAKAEAKKKVKDEERRIKDAERKRKKRADVEQPVEV
jgi:hypothetical protein